MSRKAPQTFLPLKSNWLHILLSLVEGEQHGYSIMQDVLERRDGNVRLWPATLYGSLKRDSRTHIPDSIVVEAAPGFSLAS